MNRIHILAGLAGLGFLGIAGAAQAQSPLGRSVNAWGPGTTFACESTDGRYRECRTGARRGAVHMVRQLSRTQCVQGRNWGVRGDVVWVDRGCRAEFALAGQQGRWGQQDRVICESPRNRFNRCAIDTRRGVVMVRQLSDTRCREGENWGVGRNEVWVDRGCRAEFASGDGRGRDGWRRDDRMMSGQTLQCASVDGRRNYCRAPVQRGVTLSRQLSRSACVEGRSWGWDRGGVWVGQGCRAEFRVW